MHIARGKCGHLKAKFDNHPTCISCTACIRVSPCSICSNWTKKVWSLAEKRRLYSTRKWVITQKRRQKKSKKTKSQSDLSDNGTIDGSTAHQGGRPGDLGSDRALSPPVTSQPITGQQSTGQLITGQLPINQPLVNNPPVNQSLDIKSPVIESRVIQSLVKHSPINHSPVNLSPVIQSPVN